MRVKNVETGKYYNVDKQTWNEHEIYFKKLLKDLKVKNRSEYFKSYLEFFKNKFGFKN